MLKIAVVDDEKVYIDQIQEYIRNGRFRQRPSATEVHCWRITARGLT